MQNCYFSCKVLDFTLNFSLKELACANVKEQAIVKSAQKRARSFSENTERPGSIKEYFLQFRHWHSNR